MENTLNEKIGTVGNLDEYERQIAASDEMIASRTAEKMIRIADASRRTDGTDIPLGEQCRQAAAELAVAIVLLSAVTQSDGKVSSVLWNQIQAFLRKVGAE